MATHLHCMYRFLWIVPVIIIVLDIHLLMIMRLYVNLYNKLNSLYLRASFKVPNPSPLFFWHIDRDGGNWPYQVTASYKVPTVLLFLIAMSVHAQNSPFHAQMFHWCLPGPGDLPHRKCIYPILFWLPSNVGRQLAISPTSAWPPCQWLISKFWQESPCQNTIKQRERSLYHTSLC